MVKIFSVFMLGLGMFGLCAQLTVRLSEGPYEKDKALNITIQSDQAGELKIDAALKQFEILAKSQQHTKTYLNGTLQSNIFISYTLRPKKSGTLTIDPIINTKTGESTTPINIVVEASKTPASKNHAELFFFQVGVLPDTLYLQENMVYTIDFFIDQYTSVEITQLNLSEEEGWQVETLEEGKQTKVVVNNKDYVRLRFQYILTASKVGKHPLPILKIDLLQQKIFKGNFGFSSKVRFQEVSPSSSINVRATSFEKQTGLPTSQLTLKETWEAPNTIQVGDSIKRILHIQANNLLPYQLPKLTYAYPNDLKTYSKQPVLKKTIDEHQLISQRIQEEDIVPLQSGTYILDAVTIPWFNTKTQKIENARIAARTFNVINNPKLGAQGISSKKPQPLLKQNTNNDLPAAKNTPNKPTNFITPVLYIAFALMQFGGVFWMARHYWLSKRRKLRHGIHSIHRALKNKKFKRAKRCLSDWLVLLDHQGDIYNLYQLQACFHKKHEPFFNEWQRALSNEGNIEKQKINAFVKALKKGLAAVQLMEKQQLNQPKYWHLHQKTHRLLKNH